MSSLFIRNSQFVIRNYFINHNLPRDFSPHTFLNIFNSSLLYRQDKPHIRFIDSQNDHTNDRMQPEIQQEYDMWQTV